jgi:hypothetical protein
MDRPFRARRLRSFTASARSRRGNVADKERHVLHEEVVGDEAVLAELNLDGDAILHEVRLVS